MMAPWGEGWGLASAVPVGIAFGWALERAGLGSVRTIGDQLRGRDFTVVKVMFSAIVTAMLGLFWSERLGYLDLTRVAIPVTDLVPQALGAVVFGAGFAVAALCPGTACVAAGTGKREGVVVIGGMIVGTALALLARPFLLTWFERAPRPAATLPVDLGLPAGIVIAGVVALALAAILAGSWLEGEAPPRRVGSLAAVAITLGGGALMTRDGTALPAASLGAIAGEVAAERDHVDPLELAEWIRAGKRGLRVIDVRDHLDEGTYRIPGAADVALVDLPQLVIAPGETVVLYSDGGAHAAQGWVLLRTAGARNVYVLKDGMAAWEDEVLSPSPPTSDDPAARAAFARVKALSHWFGGRPRLVPSPAAPLADHPRRRNTC